MRRVGISHIVGDGGGMSSRRDPALSFVGLGKWGCSLS